MTETLGWALVALGLGFIAFCGLVAGWHGIDRRDAQRRYDHEHPCNGRRA